MFGAAEVFKLETLFDDLFSIEGVFKGKILKFDFSLSMLEFPPINIDLI